MEKYPLTWPADKPRTPKSQQKRAQFATVKYDGNFKRTAQITIAEGVSRIQRELDGYTKVGHDYRVPKESIIISTNIPTGKKGQPLSNMSEPVDNGVAVYFQLDGVQYCLPCDKWDRVADNLAAIAAHIGALRGIERWGVGEQHDVYTGYKALPQNAGASVNAWWDILEIPMNSPDQVIHTAYKRLAKIYHTDNKATGNKEKWLAVQEAYWAATVPKY